MERDAQMLIIGSTVQNRYRVDALLGHGGMGAVYRAWDINLNRPVAIKENLDHSPEAQRQFAREAGMLANLTHANLPRVTDYFFIPDQGQYLVMDFVEGEDLQAMLGREGQLPEDKALMWIAQVCDALAYLHSYRLPIIHRDVKPANIKVTPSGKAMLVDFGIAKIYDPQLRTTMGARAVTPGYSPPEQYGMGTTTPRSDVYAVGATLYTLLTGQEPPESVERITGAALRPPRELNRQVSEKMETVVLRAMALDAMQRYADAMELHAALPTTAAQSPVRKESAEPQLVSKAAPLQAEPRRAVAVPEAKWGMKLTVRQIVVSGLMGAIAILLGVTRLGFIGPFPPLIMVSATIMHVPAIIGGVLEGPVVGLIVGLIFGVFSLLQAPTEAPPVNLWFSNPLVSILPRLFIGVTSAYVYLALRKTNEIVALAVAGLVGTLTNTVLVIGMIIVLGYAPAAVIVPAVIPNSIAEIVVAMIIVVAVVAAWKGIEGKRKGSSV
jgi:uncharacterized membrane protein